MAAAFKAIAMDGESAAQVVPKAWQKDVVALIQKNIQIPVRVIKSDFTVKTLEPNGVVLIREGFAKAVTEVKNKTLDVRYLGAGHFSVKVSNYEVKQADKALQKFKDALESEFKGKKVTVSFAKE